MFPKISNSNFWLDIHGEKYEVNKYMRAYTSSGIYFWLLAILLIVASMPAQAATNPIRALHIIVFNLSVTDAKRIIDEGNKNKFNAVILMLPRYNSLALRSTPWVVPTKLTWSRDDLLEVANYARKKNMEIIPHLPLLSHQSQLLAPHFPDLMFNSETYDPRKNKVYEIIWPIIDEIIELIHPKAIHIGHDELVGCKEKPEICLLKHGEKILPPDLFLDDVIRLHDHLKKKNVETWMWGDMLIAPEEFQTMQNDADINGSSLGYGQALRSRIPKDIVICDWHYLGKQADFPTLAVFKSNGFRVLGTTWREVETTRNFSKYAADNGAGGMIASTWIILGDKSDKVVNSWEGIGKLISESGEAFSKDFPDAK